MNAEQARPINPHVQCAAEANLDRVEAEFNSDDRLAQVSPPLHVPPENFGLANPFIGPPARFVHARLNAVKRLFLRNRNNAVPHVRATFRVGQRRRRLEAPA